MKMAKKLTTRQREVLEFIVNYIADRGFPPSIREIGGALKISSLRGVTVHLDALERKGWINRESTSRGIQVLAPIPERRKGSESIPVLGDVAAGRPILAIENVESYVMVPQEMVGQSSNVFALRVRGDSMVGDGILPGDLVIIRPHRTVTSGSLAAVLLGDEATIKRVQFDGNKTILMPSNPHYEPIVVDRDDSGIIGRVIGLVRTY